MRIFLVDYENVKAEGLEFIDYLEPEDQVVTFFSKNAETIPMGTYFKLIRSRAGFYAIQLDKSGKNALDFQLVTYLGYLMGTDGDQEIYVITGDKGFLSAVSFCRKFLIPQSRYRKSVEMCPSIASLFSGCKPMEVKGQRINVLPSFAGSVPAAVVTDDAQAPVPEEKPAVQDAVKQPVFAAAEPEKREPKQEKAVPVPEEKSKEESGFSSKRREPSRRGRTAAEKPQEEKPAGHRSDWDEIGAAAELGLPIIDLFSSASDAAKTPVKPEGQAEPKPDPAKEAVKEQPLATLLAAEPEKKQEENPLTAVQEAQPEISEPVQPKQPEEAAGEEAQILQEANELLAEAKELTAQAEEIAVVPEDQSDMEKKAAEGMAPMTGTEIDRMLDEFLQQAAQTLQETMDAKTDPSDEFIDLDAETAKEVASLAEEKPAQAQPPKEQKDASVRSDRRKSPARRGRPPKQDAEKKQPEKQPEKENSAAGAKYGARERELVLKLLKSTLEIKKDDEQAGDLNRLTDCILGAAGKQDLYRNIIRIFGQKTGLEYYKVVKREYTNICNQIGRK